MSWPRGVWNLVPSPVGFHGGCISNNNIDSEAQHKHAHTHTHFQMLSGEMSAGKMDICHPHSLQESIISPLWIYVMHCADMQRSLSPRAGYSSWVYWSNWLTFSWLQLTFDLTPSTACPFLLSSWTRGHQWIHGQTQKQWMHGQKQRHGFWCWPFPWVIVLFPNGWPWGRENTALISRSSHQSALVY